MRIGMTVKAGEAVGVVETIDHKSQTIMIRRRTNHPEADSGPWPWSSVSLAQLVHCRHCSRWYEGYSREGSLNGCGADDCPRRVFGKVEPIAVNQIWIGTKAYKGDWCVDAENGSPYGSTWTLRSRQNNCQTVVGEDYLRENFEPRRTADGEIAMAYGSTPMSDGMKAWLPAEDFGGFQKEIDAISAKAQVAHAQLAGMTPAEMFTMQMMQEAQATNVRNAQFNAQYLKSTVPTSTPEQSALKAQNLELRERFEMERKRASDLADKLTSAEKSLREERLYQGNLVRYIHEALDFMGPTMAKRFQKLRGIPDVGVCGDERLRPGERREREGRK